jgi:hypothetical protein
LVAKSVLENEVKKVNKSHLTHIKIGGNEVAAAIVGYLNSDRARRTGRPILTGEREEHARDAGGSWGTVLN